MLNKKLTILGLLLLLTAPAIQAEEDGASLVLTEMCYACHQLDSASIGPPWQAIAARHMLRKELMTEVLIGKVIRGGGGNWGLIPMVPNQRVTEEEARTMVEWVLEQTP